MDMNKDSILSAIHRGYTTGDFSDMFPLMTEDYTHISFWVQEVLRGREAAMKYYSGKGAAMKNGGNLPKGRVVRITEAPDRVRPSGMWRGGVRVTEPPEFVNRADTGKQALLLEQQSNGELVQTLLIPTVTDNGKLRQILMAHPGFYKWTEVQ